MTDIEKIEGIYLRAKLIVDELTDMNSEDRYKLLMLACVENHFRETEKLFDTPELQKEWAKATVFAKGQVRAHQLDTIETVLTKDVQFAVMAFPLLKAYLETKS